MDDSVSENMEKLHAETARHDEELLAIERPLWEKLRQEPASD
jgi:hypothetical protein